MAVSGRLLSLEFIATALHVLEPGAFNSSTFEPTETLRFQSQTLLNPLASNSFAGLSNLAELQITNPKFNLNDLPRDIFTVLSSLRHLEVSEKRDHVTDLDKIIGFHKGIETLILSWNMIETIPRGVLSRLVNLNELVMIHSQVLSIEPFAFSDLPKLLIINLGLNRLKTLPIGIFDDIVQRSEAAIYLNSNAFICDCNLLHLQEQLRNETTKWAFFQPDSYSCFDVEGGAVSLVNVELCS